MEKAYLDNVLVSAIYSDDQPSESAAIDKILEAYDQGRLDLVTSQVTNDEIDQCPEDWKKKHSRTYCLLEKVQFVEAQDLKGYNSQADPFGGFTSSPRMDDHPTWARLLQIGLDEMDAHHVMLAIENRCNWFLTCDKKTILKYRTEIETEFPPIKLMLPSELVPVLWSSGLS